MTIHTGIGGWTYPEWRKGVFYPDGLAQKRELEWASRRLGAIEINGTYHSLQKPESFRKWREATPEGFVFAVKGSSYVTNRKVLATAGESLGKFFGQGLEELGDRIGQLLAPGMALRAQDLRKLSAEAQLAAFREALVGAGVYPAEASAEGLVPYIRTFAAHSGIRYALPPGPLPGRGLLLRTAHAPHACLEADPAWGWNQAGRIAVREIPGEHLSALRPPHVATLAAEIERFLTEVSA